MAKYLATLFETNMDGDFPDGALHLEALVHAKSDAEAEVAAIMKTHKKYPHMIWSVTDLQKLPKVSPGDNNLPIGYIGTYTGPPIGDRQCLEFGGHIYCCVEGIIYRFNRLLSDWQPVGLA